MNKMEDFNHNVSGFLLDFLADFVPCTLINGFVPNIEASKEVDSQKQMQVVSLKCLAIGMETKFNL
jgi:hypothetical protein